MSLNFISFDFFWILFSCVVIFTVLKDQNFLKALGKSIQIFLNLNEKDQVNTLLYGSQTNDSKCVNQEIFKFVITYIKATTRFDRSLISNQWKLHFRCFLKYWFLLTCLVNWICIYIWLILILWLFLFVQLSNHPPIINTYVNISICLCSVRSKRLSCMNVESCFWKYLNFILYVLNVLWI